METTEIIEQFKKFFKKIEEVNIVNYEELKKFNKELAKELLENPEDTIQYAEVAVENTVRFKNIPEKVLLKDITCKHLNKFISIKAKLKEAEKIKPYLIKAKFECPSCGNVISLLQENKLKGPSRCSCGRKGKFRVISKEFIDSQILTILERGLMSKIKTDILLKEDLCSLDYLELENPKTIIINGILKANPELTLTGRSKKGFDFGIDVNYVEVKEE